MEDPDRPVVKSELSISLDGFAAGPDQSLDEPLGRGGEQLHDWVVRLAAWRERHGREGGETNPSSEVLERTTAGVGATVMGRKMFGGGPGGWGDGSWTGWWGEEPPFHVPVYVLTHHPRDPVEMKGGTVFHFVTEGPEAALELAREAAGGKHVAVAGGADTVRQFIAAGLLDELWLHRVPLLLGSGESPFAGLDPERVKLEQLDVVEGPGVTHVRYGFGG